MSIPTFSEWRRDNSGTLADYEEEVRRVRHRVTRASSASFRMRLQEGVYNVYLARVDGHDIPEGEQLPVFHNRSMSKAQAVNDALNSGLLAAIGGATRAERDRVQGEEPVSYFADEMNGYFADELGFRDPEKAAAHAVIIQGGYSSPLREAARMIADGGVHEQRARAWMEDHAYTEADLER